MQTFREGLSILIFVALVGFIGANVIRLAMFYLHTNV